MKNLIKIIFNAILCLLLQNTSWAQEDHWELRKEKEGIRVYTRDIAKFGLNEFKGECILTCGVDSVLKVLMDAPSMKYWVPDCESAKLLDEDSASQLHYTVTDLPFPLANRDAILQFHYQQTEKGYKVAIEGKPEHIPEVDGLVRIPHLKGFWIIDKIDAKRTQVTYQLHTDPGGSVPTWLANSTAVSTPYNTLKNLKEFLE